MLSWRGHKGCEREKSGVTDVGCDFLVIVDSNTWAYMYKTLFLAGIVTSQSPTTLRT